MRPSTSQDQIPCFSAEIQESDLGIIESNVESITSVLQNLVFRSVMVAGIDYTECIRILPLSGMYGCEEDSFTTATSNTERMEEADDAFEALIEITDRFGK